MKHDYQADVTLLLIPLLWFQCNTLAYQQVFEKSCCEPPFSPQQQTMLQWRSIIQCCPAIPPPPRFLVLHSNLCLLLPSIAL